MATESQFDGWRKDLGSNIRKAIEASISKNEERGEEGISDSDRAWIAMNSALLTSNVMVAERLGQIVQILNSTGDERFEQMSDRIRTGEQILSRITETAESSDLDLDDELMVSITMAEDWLNPDGSVIFATPESVEKGRDAHSKDYAETDDPDEASPDEEAAISEVEPDAPDEDPED